MNLKTIIPSREEVLKETLIVLAGSVLAAYIISRFPALQRLVTQNSVPGPVQI